MVSQTINELVKPRLELLKNACAAAEKKIAEHPDVKSEDAKLAEKWMQLMKPAAVDTPALQNQLLSMLENHADCVRFLFESNLIFTIVGYRETCGDANLHDIKFDTDGHPLLKMQNRWVRWETISREIHYDPKSEKIKSRAYAGNIVQSWSYFHPQGLVPVDRFNYDQVFDTYELTQAQYDRTRQHALKFYETNPEKDQSIPKDCIVQFFTSPRRKLPENPLFDNVNAQYPVHVSMRLITADRKVYSFGYQMIPENVDFILSDMNSNFLATADAKVTMLDYEEFRAHDGRIVTSIPATSQRALNILNHLNQLNGKQLRFQYSRQNCSLLMLEVLKLTGYEVNIRSSIVAFLYEMVPNLNQIPTIGPLIAKVEDCAKYMWDGMPFLITVPIQWTKDAILFVPKKLAMFITNLVSLKVGSARKVTPLQEGMEDEELYDKKGIQSFSSMIRNWSDIFSEESNALYNAKFFIEWQKKQKSTFIDAYTGRPKLSIVPPAV